MAVDRNGHIQQLGKRLIVTNGELRNDRDARSHTAERSYERACKNLALLAGCLSEKLHRGDFRFGDSRIGRENVLGVGWLCRWRCIAYVGSPSHLARRDAWFLLVGRQADTLVLVPGIPDRNVIPGVIQRFEQD